MGKGAIRGEKEGHAGGAWREGGKRKECAARVGEGVGGVSGKVWESGGERGEDCFARRPDLEGTASSDAPPDREGAESWPEERKRLSLRRRKRNYTPSVCKGRASQARLANKTCEHHCLHARSNHRKKFGETFALTLRPSRSS